MTTEAQTHIVGMDFIRERYGVQGVHQIEAVQDIVHTKLDTMLHDILNLVKKVDGPIDQTFVADNIVFSDFITRALEAYFLATATMILRRDIPAEDKVTLAAQNTKAVHKIVDITEVVAMMELLGLTGEKT